MCLLSFLILTYSVLICESFGFVCKKLNSSFPCSSSFPRGKMVGAFQDMLLSIPLLKDAVMCSKKFHNHNKITTKIPQSQQNLNKISTITTKSPQKFHKLSTITTFALLRSKNVRNSRREVRDLMKEE